MLGTFVKKSIKHFVTLEKFFFRSFRGLEGTAKSLPLKRTCSFWRITLDSILWEKQMALKNFEVIIVGAGVTGTALAYELA